MSGLTPWEELKMRVHKKWYQFGPIKGPKILYSRLFRNRYWSHPIFRIKTFFQRAKRGYSEEDVWGFHSHLQSVILGGLKDLRNTPPHGHPNEISYEDWIVIIDTMIRGFEAAEDPWEMTEEDKMAFAIAMNLFHKFFFDLWD